MRPRVHIIIICIFVVALQGTVRAQPPQAADDPNRLEVQLPRLGIVESAYKAIGTNADGTIQLEISPSIPPTMRRFISVTEGFYLMIARTEKDANPVRVLRVEVIDVAKGPIITARTSREAAALVKRADKIDLVRPPAATTAQLRNLPPIIPVANGSKTNDNNRVAAAKQAAARAKSINNLKQIGLAMHNFNAIYDRFPAAVIHGPDGKPWHSWRVLILPYIEQEALFRAYDFSQPWNSETNLKLLDKMPDIYRDPVYGNEKGSATHYAALVGPRAAFKPEGATQTDPKTPPIGRGGTSLRQFTDGTSNSVIVVSVDPKRKIPWTKPEDITIGAEFPAMPAPGSPGGIGTPYTQDGKPGSPAVFPALFADGSVYAIRSTIAPRTLDALCTINGGEIISRDSFESAGIPSPKIPTLKVRIDGGNAEATID